jgi:hypothetical protein
MGRKKQQVGVVLEQRWREDTKREFVKKGGGGELGLFVVGRREKKKVPRKTPKIQYAKKLICVLRLPSQLRVRSLDSLLPLAAASLQLLRLAKAGPGYWQGYPDLFRDWTNRRLIGPETA